MRLSVRLRVASVVGDVAFAAVAVAGVVCAVIGRWDDVVRFAVVIGVLAWARLGRLIRPLYAALAVTLLLATVAMAADWYARVPWVDIPIHAATTGAVAASMLVGLIRVGLLPGLHSRLLVRQRAAVVLLVTAIGVTVGVGWECYEWVATHVFGVTMVVGYTDTIGDLTMDAAGSILAGLGVAAWAGRGHTARSVADQRTHTSSPGDRRD
jgi:hypothetical protein